MYIWKVNALVRDLRWGRIGRVEKLKYGSLMFAAASLCWVGASDQHLDALVNAMLILAAQLGAIYLCYCANTHGDGRDFWVRFYTLGVPVALRSACVLTPIAFFASLPSQTLRPVLGNAADMLQMLWMLPDVVLLTLGIVAWGWRVSVHMERTAGGRR